MIKKRDVHIPDTRQSSSSSIRLNPSHIYEAVLMSLYLHLKVDLSFYTTEHKNQLDFTFNPQIINLFILRIMTLFDQDKVVKDSCCSFWEMISKLMSQSCCPGNKLEHQPGDTETAHQSVFSTGFV